MQVMSNKLLKAHRIYYIDYTFINNINMLIII